MVHCTVHRSAKGIALHCTGAEMLCTALAPSVYTGGAPTVHYGAVHFWEPLVDEVAANKAQ